MKRLLISVVVVALATGTLRAPRALAADAPVRVTLTAARSLDASDWPAGRKLLELPPIALDAGQSRLIRGRLEAASVTDSNQEQQVGVACDGTEGGVLRTSRNNEGLDHHYSTGDGVLDLDVRYLFTPVTAGSFICSLWGKSSGNALTARAATGQTYLEVIDPAPGASQWLAGPCDSRGTVSNTSDNAYDSECVYLVPPTASQDGTSYPSQTHTLTQASLTADPAASAISLGLDLQLSTCYGGTGSCIVEVNQYGGDRRGGTSVVDSRADIVQLDATGQATACGARTFSPALGEGNSPSGAYRRTVIAGDTHHVKLRYVVTVPVSQAAGCTRTFLARLFVRSVSGDPVKLLGSRMSRSGAVTLAFSNAIATNAR